MLKVQLNESECYNLPNAAQCRVKQPYGQGTAAHPRKPLQCSITHGKINNGIKVSAA